MPDLTLRLVEETARLRLPAQLIPSLLAFAVNDYWHDVQARFGDDWWRMTRQARDLGSARVEDYVAALTWQRPTAHTMKIAATAFVIAMLFDPVSPGVGKAPFSQAGAEPPTGERAQAVQSNPVDDIAIRIVSPEPDTYIVGSVRLSAVIEPARQVRNVARVMFYADGRLVCTHHGSDARRVPVGCGHSHQGARVPCRRRAASAAAASSRACAPRASTSSRPSASKSCR